MVDKDDFSRAIAEYQLTYGHELQARMKRLDGIIGDRHWLTVGTYKENLIKSVLGNRLPRKYEVSTGFVLACKNKKRLISRQIDVLIWDSENHAPIFRDGNFVIVSPEACVAAIEVKSKLTQTELKSSLQNLDSLMQFFPDFRTMENKVLHRSVFAFELDKKLKFPAGVFNAIHSSYKQSDVMEFKERTSFSSINTHRWQLPWISTVSILGVGNIDCDLWGLNRKPHVVLTAYQENAGNQALDAYGFLERSVIMDLTLGYDKISIRNERPGMYGVLFANKAEYAPGKWYMPVEAIEITQVGMFKDKENQDWIEKQYKPRTTHRSK